MGQGRRAASAAHHALADLSLDGAAFAGTDPAHHLAHDRCRDAVALGKIRDLILRQFGGLRGDAGLAAAVVQLSILVEAAREARPVMAVSGWRAWREARAATSSRSDQVMDDIRAEPSEIVCAI